MLYRRMLVAGLVLGLLMLPTVTGAVGKQALLIGIGEYGNNPTFTPLKGPANDVTITKTMLHDRFQFPEQNIITLMDAQATHTGIATAFQQLRDRVNNGDFVYIHYSGHGSQTADLNGDEPEDHLDETWVSYGSRQDATSTAVDNYDVLDDEIDAWLAAIYAKTAYVVFVSDSCHSATVSRGQEDVARAAEKDKRDYPFGTDVYAKPPENLGVRIGAARDWESAIDFPVNTQAENKEEKYGVFTYYWVEALQQAQETDSWNDVFKRAASQVMAKRADMQQPQIWGERGLQLSGVIAPLQPTIPVTFIVDSATVVLGAGLLSGVTRDSVYRSADPANSGRLKIIEVKTFESTGHVQGTFKQGDLLIEEEHVYQPRDMTVVALKADFPDQEDRPILQALQQALQPTPDNAAPPLPGYTFASPDQSANLHLYVVRPKLENGTPVPHPQGDILPLSFCDQPPEVWVLTPDHRQLLYAGLKIPFDDLTKGMKILQKNLNTLARIKELNSLESSQNAPLPVSLEAYLWSPANACDNKPNCRVLPDDLGCHCQTGPHTLDDIRQGSFVENEILTFTLHNTAQESVYSYLLDIDPDGNIQALFPSAKQPASDALLNGGEKRQIRTGVKLGIAGTETIKILTTRQPFDVLLLETEGFPRRNSENPLEQLLINGIYRQGNGVVRRGDDEWATEQVSFEVTKK